MRPVRAVGFLLIGLGLTCPSPARAFSAFPPDVTHDRALESMFNTYGNAGRGDRWTGSDGTFSARLPDGRVVWFMGDTILGKVHPDGSQDAPGAVHNTLLVQRGSKLVATLYTGKPPNATAYVDPTPADTQTFYWPGAMVVEKTAAGQRLQMFASRMLIAGNQWVVASSDIVTVSLPGLKVESITRTPAVGRVSVQSDASLIAYGTAVTTTKDWTYIYGTESANGRKWLHVARVPRDHLVDGTWEYWTSGGWSTTPLLSSRILVDVADDASVVPTKHGYRMVVQDIGISPHISIYTAKDPQGPWGAQRVLAYTTPETKGAVMTYNAKEHPELDRPDHIVVSYNVIATDFSFDKDVNRYRPRFIDVWIPSDLR